MSFGNQYEDYYKEYIRDGAVTDIPAASKIYMPEDTVVDIPLIERLLSEHKSEMARIALLQDYYRGYASIYDRVKKNPKKPNNRLAAPYPSYITDVLVGMFIGEPPTYSSFEEDEEGLSRIQQIFDYNDEQDENFEMANFCSITGKSYEIIYIDRNKKIRFNELDPKQVIYVYDDNINPEPLFAIYFIDVEGDRIVHVYERDTIRYFKGSPLTEFYVDENGVRSEEGSSLVNPLGKLPILECLNNTEILGDFERVLPLIDAYNKSISDTANDFEEFTDSLLLLFGMLNATGDDIRQADEDGVLLLGEGQSAEWLTKVINTEALENHKERLDDDIHRFSKIPNLTDEKFGGNSSGVALQYKLLALDQVIAAKQRKFKRFLQDRLEVILDFMDLMSEGVDIEHWDIDISFNSNVPIDEKANVEMVKSLMEVTSENTALSQLFFIKNANEEMEKKRQELDAYSPGIKDILAALESEEPQQEGDIVELKE